MERSLAVKDESYQLLVDEIKATITESVHNSRWDLIVGYWTIGRLIREEIQLKKWSQNEAGRVLSDLAKDTSISKRTLYRALACFDKFPDINRLPEGKNISWSKLITFYLPDKPKDLGGVIKITLEKSEAQTLEQVLMYARRFFPSAKVRKKVDGFLDLLQGKLAKLSQLELLGGGEK